MSKLEKIFEGNWDEIKGKLKTQWGKLTDNDIKQIDGSFEEFIGKLKKSYGYEVAKIEEEIKEFFEANDFETVNTKAKTLKGEALAKSEEIKEMVRESVAEYFDKLKNSTIKTEEKLMAYCKSNPLKTAGMILLTGFAFATLISKKK